MTDSAPLIIAALFGGFGLVVGSFLGRVSLRLPAREGIVRGRSRCGGCGRALPPWRLIPLVGYAVARGRCHDCGAPIPAHYPLMEAGCALIGVWAALSQWSLIAAVLTALLGWQLLLIAVIDGEHFWLPDSLTLPLLVTGLSAAALLERSTLVDAAMGAGLGFAALWLIGRAYRSLRGREGVGGGDPYLLAAGGAWVGWVGLPSILLWAATAGLSVVLGRVLLGRRVSGGDRMPFGVFLALGVWLTWLFGPLGLPR
ncbi:MAG: A24 family peptidase [Brevundimonas sp.]|uniref:prepilin peptidase n=1 Tax=Brevundimonas sp. TaxID=1871086 RepID=UPI00271C1BE7|nr:A24 family peptidase [Brevundimonas sp.]MDO9587306.1 A24 family peptidase [Brevundimonas sp.]MDP3369015.1 A24 family peptidase [Brevundimonas sp.]